MIRAFFCLFVFAATALSQTAPDPLIAQARDILSAGYASRNPDTRTEVAAVVGLIGKDQNVVAGLHTLLGDEDYRVRLAAIGGLADVSDVASDPLLARMLTDDVPEVAFAAAKVLWAQRSPSARELLLEIVAKEERGGSNFLARKFRDTSRMFKSPKTAMMFGLRNGLGFVPVPGLGLGFSAFEALVLDPAFTPRAHALMMLAVERSDDTDRAILAALEDDDWSMRAVAVQALAQQNRLEHRATIATRFTDKKEQVRFRAAAGYLRLVLLEKLRAEAGGQ